MSDMYFLAAKNVSHNISQNKTCWKEDEKKDAKMSFFFEKEVET